MRVIFIGVFIAVFIGSAGCAVNAGFVKVAFGGGEIRDGCDENNVCENVTKADEAGAEMLDFVSNLLDAIPFVELGERSSSTPAVAEGKPKVIYVHPGPEDAVGLRPIVPTLEDFDNTLNDPASGSGYPPKGHGSTLGWIDEGAMTAREALR